MVKEHKNIEKLTSMRAFCNCTCQPAATLQILSHRLLLVSSLALNSSARAVSSVWSARWVPTIFKDRMILLWLSRSKRKTWCSWMTSSSCSMLAGGALHVFWVPSADLSHFSSRHRSLSSWDQLRLVQSGQSKRPASLKNDDQNGFSSVRTQILRGL